MRKSGVIFGILFFLILLNSVFIFAANETNSTNTTVTSNTTINTTSTQPRVNASRVENGFMCLEEKVKSDCSGATNIQDMALTILASPKNVVDDCTNKLKTFKRDNCFGASSCTVKETALAVLALNHIGEKTDVYENWLLNQTRISTDIIWYLQQDSNGRTQCKITYNSQDYNFNVAENKKIDVPAGNCLSPAQSNYWFQVSPSCYGTDFALTCDQDFIATFMYKQPTSQTIYVLSDTKSASANQIVNLKIRSKCFGTGSCEYEASAWAVLALQKVGRNVDEFVPYLISSEDSNKKYLPAAFLHMIVDYSEYGTKLVQQQKLNNWEAENTAYNKFYDTSLAIMALSESNQEQVVRAREWLLNLAQEANGCWNNGNIRDTAMALWALEGRGSTFITPDSGGVTYCTDANFFCVASAQCATDQKLNNYFCSGVGKTCCKVENSKTCSEKFGTVCSAGTVCNGVVEGSKDAAQCCLSNCIVPTTTNENSCEANNGYCRTSCSANQKETSFECADSGDVCCKTEITVPVEKSYWWLWLLLILLIILIIIAILKRDKIKVWIYKKKSGYSEESSATNTNTFPPRGGPGPAPYTTTRTVQRTTVQQKPVMYPPRTQTPQARPVQKPAETDDVFKKLKEMSK